MKKNVKNEELQSRREFFKKAAKGALPILGAIVLASMPVVIHADAPSMGCGSSCKGRCLGACSDGNCRLSCDNSCKNTCAGTCRNGCLGGCKGNCQGTCKNGAKK